MTHTTEEDEFKICHNSTDAIIGSYPEFYCFTDKDNKPIILIPQTEGIENEKWVHVVLERINNYQKLIDSNRELLQLLKEVLIYDLKGVGGWHQYNVDQIESFRDNEAEMQKDVAEGIRKRIERIETAINNFKNLQP